MPALRLVLANKAYSSWSMRPWLLMRALGIAFDEVVIPLDRPDTAAAIAAYNPAGKLPVLIDRAAEHSTAGRPLVLWDSLAIIEHLAERHPGVWPAEAEPRALARSLSAEMHSGFLPLRRALPMNMRRAPAPLAALDDAATAAVAADVARIEAAFADALARFGGPFLCGAFSAADAMFAPVISRLHSYSHPVAAPTRRYMDAIMALPAWRDWQAAAVAEDWRIERFERR